MLTRYSDWQSRLDCFLVENRARSFSYGSWDCCLFVCDAVQAMTGIDMAEPLRGKYETRPGSLDALFALFGVRTLRAGIARIATMHGLQECAERRLRRGDIGLIERPHGDCSLGLVTMDGKGLAVLTAREMSTVPLALAARGWHV